MTKQYYFFKPFTKAREKMLNSFEHLTDEQFDELTAQARAEFNAQNVTAKHGSRSFDNESAFVSSGDTLNGYYFPSAELVDIHSGFELLLISFEIVRSFDFERHEWKPETLRPLAIYKDAAENLYTRHATTLDTRPLEDWKQKLQKDIDNYKTRAELWRNVKRLYKKNGEAFAVFSKNFDGVKIVEEWNRIKFQVSGRTQSGDWITDWITDSEAWPLAAVEDVLPTINKYIEQMTENAATLENTLKNADTFYFDIFGGLFEKLLKYETPSDKNKIKLSHPLWIVRDLLQKFYYNI